jgi:hypothetical protein
MDELQGKREPPERPEPNTTPIWTGAAGAGYVLVGLIVTMAIVAGALWLRVELSRLGCGW